MRADATGLTDKEKPVIQYLPFFLIGAPLVFAIIDWMATPRVRR